MGVCVKTQCFDDLRTSYGLFGICKFTAAEDDSYYVGEKGETHPISKDQTGMPWHDYSGSTGHIKLYNGTIVSHTFVPWLEKGHSFNFSLPEQFFRHENDLRRLIRGLVLRLQNLRPFLQVCGVVSR